jgi:hypothetical protein
MRSLFVSFDISLCLCVAAELMRKCDVIITQLLLTQAGYRLSGQLRKRYFMALLFLELKCTFNKKRNIDNL